MEPTTYDTPGPLSLTVRVPSGRVLVSAESTTVTTLHVTGERSPDEVSVQFEALNSGHRLTIERRRSGIFGLGKSHDVEVRVTVPDGTKVTVEGGSIGVEARGTLGSLEFNSGSGDASVDSVTGDAKVKVASGDLDIRHVGGAMSFHSASGAVTAGDVGGDITARTASGDVRLNTVHGMAKVTTVSGDIAVSTLVAGGSTSLQAVSGDIVVGVSEGTDVYLDLSAVSGSTQSELTVSDHPSAHSGGERAVEIKAATVSGDINVRRSRV